MRTLFTLTNHIWPLKTIFNIWEIFINKKWNPKAMLGSWKIWEKMQMKENREEKLKEGKK